MMKRFIEAASFSGTKTGYIYKLGPCGLGYYRDGATDDSDDDCTEFARDPEEEAEAEEQPSPSSGNGDDLPSPPLTMTVEVFSDAEEALQKAVEFYKRLRAKDGRQKAAVVVIADGDKPLSRLPPKFGIPQVKVKAKSKKGIGSASKSKFGYAGTGVLNAASVGKDDKDEGPEAVIRDWRSGKVSTVFASDDAISLLSPAAGRTQVVIQVTRFPALAAFRRRRDVLNGQYGNQGPAAGEKPKVCACFFSGGSGAGAADAAALVSRLRHEGQQISQSLQSYASKNGDGVS